MQEKEYIANLPLYFIVGTPRSGTTLMSSMLNAHHNLLATHENPFILTHYTWAHKKRHWAKADIDFLLKYLWIRHADFAQIWKIDMELLRCQLYALLPNTDYPTICKAIHLSHQSAQSKNDIRAIIDKNPMYSWHTERWIQLFENTKFIVMLRDYRDNLVSLQHKKSQTERVNLKNPLASFGWYYDYTVLATAAQKQPDRYCPIRYEDLILNPQDTLQKVCHFLGVTYTSQMLDYPKQNPPLVFRNIDNMLKKNDYYEKLNQLHANVNKPLNTEALNQWHNTLNHREVAIAESLCGNIGQKWGYTETLNLNNWQKIRTLLPYSIGILIGYIVKAIEKYFAWLPVRIQHFLVSRLKK